MRLLTQASGCILPHYLEDAHLRGGKKLYLIWTVCKSKESFSYLCGFTFKRIKRQPVILRTVH